MNFISVLADAFNFLLVNLCKTLYKLLHINCAIVTFLISTFENLKQTVSDQVFPIIDVLKCYHQDFIIFLYEVISIVRFVITSVSEFLGKLQVNISSTFAVFQEVGIIIHQNVIDFSTIIYFSVLQVTENAAYLLGLIFRSLLLILESGPNALIFLYQITLVCLPSFLDFIVKSVEQFLYYICNLLLKSVDAVYSFPVKAYFGILLFIALSYQYKVLIVYLKMYIDFLLLFLEHIWNQINPAIYMCLSAVIKIMKFDVFRKIKGIFSSVEETGESNNATNAHINSQRNSLEKNVFHICITKAKTSFYRYYYKEKVLEGEKIEKLQKELMAEREKHLCIICFDRPRNMMLYPCSHLCICEECCITLQAELRGCPICRRNVQNVLHVFT